MTAKTRHLLDALKILGVVAGVLASAFGSYQAAKSKARTEADSSYQELKQSVEHLEATQRLIWGVLMKSPPAFDKSLDAPAASQPMPFPAMRPLPRDMGAVMQSRK